MRKILFILTVAGILLGGCAHQNIKDRQEILEDPNIEQQYKNAVDQERIIAGMTPKMVIAVLGEPRNINYVTVEGHSVEEWVYAPSTVGQMFRARCGIPLKYKYVIFENNKVVGVFSKSIQTGIRVWK